MDMGEVLSYASSYIQQLEKLDGEHNVYVPPALAESLAKAAREAKTELEGMVQYQLQ